MGKNARVRKEQKIIEKYGALPKDRQPLPWLKIGVGALIAVLVILGLRSVVQTAQPKLTAWYHKVKIARSVSNTSPAPTQNSTSEITTAPTTTNQKESHRMIATITTTLGDIKLELFDKDAPKTVDNFKKLADKGYYKGVIFHRVIKDFMIQGGDPTGTGTGGASAEGGKFNDEFNSHKIVAGTLAMANAGPNTNGSQFFIVTESPQPHLDGKHTAFGQVIDGMDVVKKIAAVPVDANDKPLTDVKMTKVTVAEE